MTGIARWIATATLVIALPLLGGCGTDEPADPVAKRGSDKPATSTGDEPEQPDAATEASATPDQATTKPLAIRVAQVTDTFGNEVELVEQIGPVGWKQPLPAATRALGPPATTAPGEQAKELCVATWPELGLELAFYFGHPPTYRDSCRRGPVGAGLMTGDRWQLQPSGVSIGASKDEVRAAIPDARREPLLGPFEDVPGSDDALLLAEGSYGGDLYPTLYATFRDDRLAAFVYVSGAD